MMPMVREGTIALDAIVIDDTYLPRSKPNTSVINDYAEAMINGAVFPPIIVEEGTNKLISGYHRTKAYLKYDELKRAQTKEEEPQEQIDLWPVAPTEVACEFHTIPEDQSPKLYGYSFNKTNSLRQSGEDAKMVCQAQYRQFPGCTFKLLIDHTGLSEPTIRKYLGELLQEFEETRNAGMQRLGFLGWTQEEIAEALKRRWPEVGLNQSSVGRVFNEIQKVSDFIKTDFVKGLTTETLAKRYAIPEILAWAIALEGKTDHERLQALDIAIQPYDVLHFQGSDNRFGTDEYPGRIPGQLVAHVLHWFTKPGATVIDPMGGGGTVPDVCLAMGRECYAYDINKSERLDIIPYNIATEGWPERTKKADLIFWDPPYFDKKDDGYPEGSISHLERNAYLDFFKKAFREARTIVKKGTRLAFIMSDWNEAYDAKKRRESIFLWDYVDLLKHAGWEMREHLQVPLSTQQVHPDIVNKFRASGHRARLERYLLIAEA